MIDGKSNRKKKRLHDYGGWNPQYYRRPTSKNLDTPKNDHFQRVYLSDMPSCWNATPRYSYIFLTSLSTCNMNDLSQRNV